MSMFDTWDTITVNVSPNRGQKNRVTMKQYTKNTPKGGKIYRRLIVSQNLIVESGAERFTLKNKGNVFALVPDPDGPLSPISTRMLGISSVVLDDIVEKIGEDECQASVIDGAIVFPIRDNFIIG